MVVIPAGRYEIGDESTLNARPRHFRRFDHPIWLDRYPVSLVQLENVVTNGRFRPSAFQLGTTAPGPIASHSVDSRYRAVLETNLSLFSREFHEGYEPTNLPVCGLTWPEAVQVCQFFDARLPTEAEWELGMKGIQDGTLATGKVVLREASDQTRPVLRTSPQLFTESLQEWTGDPWTPRYWRGDDRNTAPAVVGDALISVRGCTSTGFASLYARTAANQLDVSVPRVFRRVWDHKPELA